MPTIDLGKVVPSINSKEAVNGNVDLTHTDVDAVAQPETENDSFTDGSLSPWVNYKEELSSLKDHKAPVITEEASGSIITIDDAAAMNVRGLVSTIKPVQAEGTPTPENPLPISGWDAVHAMRTGKNLLDAQEVINFTQSYRINAILPPGKYVLSCGDVSSGGEDAPAFRVYDDEDRNLTPPISLKTNAVLEFEIAQRSAFLYFYSNGFSYANSEGVAATINQLMVSTASALYEPYQGQTLTAALPETVYGGTLDWKTGVLTKTHEVVTFYGEASEGWKRASSGGYPFVYTDVKKAAPNQHRPITSHTTNTACVFVNNTQFRSYLFATLQEWMDMLQMQAALGTPFQVYYPLVNQETIQLTPQQLETLKGLNNVWSDCGDTSIVYCADTKIYIDKQIAAAVALALNG